MLQHWFYKTMNNGETVLRSWLLYSMMNKSLYCFYCGLFQKTEQRKSSLARNLRLQKFWKLNSKIPEHENSSNHLRAFKEWKMLEMTLNKTLDSKLQEQTMEERQIWRQVLSRLLVVKVSDETESAF